MFFFLATVSQSHLRLWYYRRDLWSDKPAPEHRLDNGTENHNATVRALPALNAHAFQGTNLGAWPLHAGEFADFLGGEQHHFFFRGARGVISFSAAQLGYQCGGGVAGFSD